MTKKYIIGVLLITLATLLFFTPFTILFFIKIEDWTKTADSFDLTAGVLIGLAYALLVLRGAFQYVSKMISGLISLIVFTSIFYFLQGILDDLFWISLSVLIGYILFWGFAAWGKREKEIAKIYADEGYKIKAREAANSQQLSRRSRNINAIK